MKMMQQKYYNLCFNEYMKKSAISEGKIELTSTIDGLFKVNREELLRSILLDK